ncbi:unnamed protein product [Trichogramma brassicae]|uniref:Uncharacterized protein n=1 Tax=Trichogramma brassicae TaxID=86971 RepID=A0A6H5J4L3_9HYME|nr:unnamed protein product [Trichogramma brassicae]
MGPQGLVDLFLRCDLVKIFNLNRCHWRTSGRSPQLTDGVVQPLAKLAGVDARPGELQ